MKGRKVMSAFLFTVGKITVALARQKDRGTVVAPGGVLTISSMCSTKVLHEKNHKFIN